MTTVARPFGSASQDVGPEVERDATFEELLTGVLSTAYRTVIHLVKNAADAEQVLSDATGEAVRRFGEYRRGMAFRTWYLGIVAESYERHRATSARLAPRRRDPAEEGRPVNHHTRGGADASVAFDLSLFTSLEPETVSRALALLPEEVRTPAVHYFMDDFSYQEIADILDCTVSTVRTRLQQARTLLRHSLEEVVRHAGEAPRHLAEMAVV